MIILCLTETWLKPKHMERRREYGFRVREVERGSFTPLVFTTNGGAAPEAVTFLKRLGSQISDKKNEPYSVVMNFLRCRLSFSLLRSSLLCLRGSRSNRSLNTTCLSQDSLSLVASEGFFGDLLAKVKSWVICRERERLAKGESSIVGV